MDHVIPFAKRRIQFALEFSQTGYAIGGDSAGFLGHTLLRLRSRCRGLVRTGKSLCKTTPQPCFELDGRSVCVVEEAR